MGAPRGKGYHTGYSVLIPRALSNVLPKVCTAAEDNEGQEGTVIRIHGPIYVPVNWPFSSEGWYVNLIMLTLS